MFQFNVQHDCENAQCTASGEHPVIQEHVESGLSENFVVHHDNERYLINTHGQHNAHLIRATLPRELTIPIPFVLDQAAHHMKISANYHTTQDSKRAVVANKAMAKKNAAVTAAGSQPGPSRKRKRAEELGSTQMAENMGGIDII
jgi:hypothetical protein